MAEIFRGPRGISRRLNRPLLGLLLLSRSPAALAPALAASLYLEPPLPVGPSVTVTPAPGQVTITGVAPNVINPNVTVSPAPGQVTITGATPGVQNIAPTVVQPSVGQITITGATLTLAFPDKTVSPALGQITITGAAPSVLNIPPTILQPGIGQITISGSSPTVVIIPATIVQPGVGSITITGLAPDVRQFIPIGLAPDYDPAVDFGSSAIVSQTFRDLQMAPPAYWADPAEQIASVLEMWPETHATLLENCDWSFASAFVLLSAVDPAQGAASEPDQAWLYRVPGDLIQVREVGVPGVTKWRIDGEWLRADAPPPLRLRYTSRVTDPALLPAAYRRAVALKLAAQLAPRWIGRTPDAMRIEIAAEEALALAKKIDGKGTASAAAYDPDADDDRPYLDWASEALE